MTVLTSAGIVPMSPLDATFLHIEDGISHMHIGSCAIFEGPSPELEEIVALIESKLPLLTRYRQRVRFVPGGLGHPVWVDDPRFRLADHVHHESLGRSGSDRDLEELMALLMSSELNRRRPLWDTWVVSGLAEDRWALISKVHHCMVDGISGTDLMAMLLDRDPNPPISVAPPWRPSPEPSDLRLVLDAVTRMTIKPARELMASRPRDVNVGRVLKGFADVMVGLGSLGARLLVPGTTVSVEGAIGVERRWAAGRCSLQDAKAIGHAFDASVNDVVLAAITGAFRTMLAARGEPVDNIVFRSLVPVSVRHADDHTFNNQVSLLIAELPVGIEDPVERLRAVHEEISSLKAAHQVEAGEAVLATAGFVPPVLLAMGAHAAMGLMRRLPQRSVNTVTTNVPGPQFPLYALGRRMVEYLPFVPLSEGIRIGIAILSYDGLISFGVTGDYDTVPDVRTMADEIEAEVKLLRRRVARPTTRAGMVRHA
jgi:diacylglycerol O-acyltransferase / wax synthase